MFDKELMAKAEAEEGPQNLLPRTKKMYSDKVNFYNAIIPKKELVVQKAKSHYDAVISQKQQAILKLEEDHKVRMDRMNRMYQEKEAQAEEALSSARTAWMERGMRGTRCWRRSGRESGNWGAR